MYFLVRNEMSVLLACMCARIALRVANIRLDHYTMLFFVNNDTDSVVNWKITSKIAKQPNLNF